MLVILHMPGEASASVNDFVINNFQADYYLNNNDKQGQMRVVEQIDLIFSDDNHGILRAIPRSYKGKSLELIIADVTSPSGAPAEYTTYKENDNLVLKIGSPSSTVTGRQNYTVDYTVSNVINFYDGYDELFWDVNGDQWLQPFTKVTARLHLPKGVELTNKSCFAGEYGEAASDCSME